MRGRLAGVYPILATAFDEAGEIDESSQRRLIDFLIDKGVHGLVLMANASEGHTLSDVERDRLADICFDQIQGRVPIIVTINHFSSKVASERARHAQSSGAAAVMSMPPFFGRWGAEEKMIIEYYRTISDQVDIPVMVQDHELSGIVMSAQFLARLAGEIPKVEYFKIEVVGSPYKISEVLRLGDEDVLGVFGGASGISLIEELDRGSCGTMPACYMPRVFRRTYDLFMAGRKQEAREFFSRYLPLINFELHSANRCLWKEILKSMGVIRSATIRSTVPASWDEVTRRQLSELVEGLSISRERWG